MDRRICVDLGPASPFEGSWMTPGSDCLRVEPQCQLPTFHQSPVVLRPVANLISEGVVAFAPPLAYQEGERWGWSQISATTPTQAARPGRAGGLSAAQGDRGTSDRGFETTAWNAAVPAAGPGEGRGGVRAGRNGLQPHPPVAQQTEARSGRLVRQTPGPATRRRSKHQNSGADHDPF